MFRNTAVFLCCSNLDLDWPIALPSLTASVLSRQSWESQDWETHLARQEGRWVRKPFPRPPEGAVRFAFTSPPLGRSPMASRAFQSERFDGMERQQVGRERGCGGWVVGGPTSLCQSSKGGGGPAACWKGRPPRPWRGHDDHQRPCRLTDSSQSSSHLPRVRSRLLPPSLSCHCHLDTAHTCYQTVVKLELNLKLVQLETFGESLAKVLWRWRGVG